MITEFNKTKEYNKNLKEKVEEIKRICNNLDIPCFLTFCVKNNEMETVYQTEYLSPGQKQQYLKNNRFADYVNIINGFTTTPYKEEDIFTTRLRPSYFPFTEPSVEVDVSCFQCGGCGCKLCKGTGWIEVLGAGVVNNKVLEGCGVDTEEYSGFAFGIGIERIAMLKYGINNIKLLFESDLRVLKQIDD